MLRSTNQITSFWGNKAILLIIHPQIVSELRDKSKYYEEDGMVSTLELNAAVVKSDTAIPSELADSLRQACRRLEDVPEKDKDWHPGSVRL